MTLSEPLRQALLDYAAIEHNVSTATPDRDDEAKRALVRDRRLLSEQIGRLGLLIERDEVLAADTGTQRETSQLFSAMRYALALHQADWPVVRIDENPAAYRASAHQVQVKSAAFWRWCREGLNLHDRAAATGGN